MALRTQNAQEWAAKTAQRAAAAVDDYRKGVQRVQTSPTAQAADNIDGYLNGVNQAVSSGRMENRLRAVSLSDWQQATLTKGPARYTQGLQAAQAKMQSGGQRLLAAVAAAQAAIANMPRATFEDRLARSQAYQREMHRLMSEG